MADRYVQKHFPVVTLSFIAISTVSFVAGIETHIFPLYLFSHSKLYHLVINMLMLWVFGSFLEPLVGWKRFALFFFISAAGSDILWRFMEDTPLTGASGGVSGLMGIYFYRCHYLKITARIPVQLIIVNIKMHAGWFLYYWLLWHVYSPFYNEYNAAFSGGLAAGVIIGISRGKAEDLFHKAAGLIDRNYNLAEAEEALTKALSIAPRDPNINLEAARLYANRHDKEAVAKSKKYYIEAARSFYLQRSEKETAGIVLLEYILKFQELTEPDVHLKYATALAGAGDYNSAALILEPLVDSGSLPEKTAERVLLKYIHFTVKSGLGEKADYGYKKLIDNYPHSLLIKEAGDLLNSPVTKSKTEISLEHSSKKDSWANAMNSIIADITSVTSDIEPGNLWESDLLFWVLLSSMALFSPLLLAVMSTFQALIIIVVVPFIVSFVRKGTMSFFGNMYSGSRSKTDAQGQRDFNLGYYMDKASACEVNGEFEEAVEYLRGVLAEDNKNILAQYKVASIYHKKLNIPSSAIREYRRLIEIAPEGHPFGRDAHEAIEELEKIKGK